MLSKTAGGIKTNYTYNAGNQLVGDGTYKYTYDKIGNLVEKRSDGGLVQYAYNAMNLLERWMDGENTETYSYNAAGLLSTVNTNSSTTSITWDILYGDGVVISANENGAITDYTYGLERISASSGRARTEYVYDGRGSVIGEVTKSGLLSSAKVTIKNYTPFGEQIGEKTSGFGWNGEYYNATTGQVYLRARFYEPEQNRFSQKDMLRGSTANAITQNRYLYCINDPLNFVDPSGKALGLLAGTAIAAGLCGLVAGATSAYQSYKSTGKVDWKQAGKAAVGGVTAAVAVGVAVATGGTGLGVATMVVEAVAGGRTALRGGNAADVTTSMAKAGVSTVIAGNVLPVLPNVAKAVIGTAGATGGVVKTVNNTKAASNTFKDPNATTLDKINAVVDVALDVAGTAGSAAYAVNGINGIIADAKATSAAKQPTVACPQKNVNACEKNTTSDSINTSQLRYNGDGTWTSNEGVIYGQGSKQGNRVLHILEHLKPDASKPQHTVFDVDRSQLIGLIDEAWINKGAGTMQANGNVYYEVDMGHVIGTNGETIIKIVTKGFTNEIITAYPIS